MDACVNVVKRVCSDNPIFPLIQCRFVHSSSDHCTRSNRSFTNLPSNTDRLRVL